MEGGASLSFGCQVLCRYPLQVSDLLPQPELGRMCSEMDSIHLFVCFQAVSRVDFEH